jgi:hypothetical protein
MAGGESGTSALGTQSWPHRAQRILRGAANTAAGTSYAASQAGQTIFITKSLGGAVCKISPALGNRSRCKALQTNVDGVP